MSTHHQYIHLVLTRTITYGIGGGLFLGHHRVYEMGGLGKELLEGDTGGEEEAGCGGVLVGGGGKLEV